MKHIDLVRLIEECGEVIQAATKILRFGEEGKIAKLTSECGDVLACIDKLRLDDMQLGVARYAKHRKLRRMDDAGSDGMEYPEFGVEKVKLTVEEVSAIALNSGFMISNQYGQLSHQKMPVADMGTLVEFANNLVNRDK